MQKHQKEAQLSGNERYPMENGRQIEELQRAMNTDQKREMVAGRLLYPAIDE